MLNVYPWKLGIFPSRSQSSSDDKVTLRMQIRMGPREKRPSAWTTRGKGEALDQQGVSPCPAWPWAPTRALQILHTVCIATSDVMKTVMRKKLGVHENWPFFY